MHPMRCVLILTVVLLERNVVITSNEDSHEPVNNCSKPDCMNVSLLELLEGSMEILTSNLCEGGCLWTGSFERPLPCECKLNGSALETRVGHLFIDFGQKIFAFYNKTSSDSDVVPEYAERFKNGNMYWEINWFAWQIGRCTRFECQQVYWRLVMVGNQSRKCSCEFGDDEEKELSFAHYIFQTGVMLLSFKPEQ